MGAAVAAGGTGSSCRVRKRVPGSTVKNMLGVREKVYRGGVVQVGVARRMLAGR